MRPEIPKGFENLFGLCYVSRMRAHKSRVQVTDDHQVVVRLPSDFPRGDADVIVLANAAEDIATKAPFDQWLDTLLKHLPPAQTLSIDSLRRENLYD